MKKLRDIVPLFESEIKPVHQHLNKSQLKSLNKHKSFNTYVHSLGDEVYARPDTHDGGPGKRTRNFVVATAKGKHRMHVAMTHQGKVLGHSIYRKHEENGHTEWHHVKSEDGK